MLGLFEQGTPTTRRTLLSAAALTAAGTAVAAPATKAGEADWAAFITSMDRMHPNGRATALNALRAGVRLEDLNMIMLRGMDGTPPEMLPVLMFNAPAPQIIRTFRPRGED